MLSDLLFSQAGAKGGAFAGYPAPGYGRNWTRYYVITLTGWLVYLFGLVGGLVGSLVGCLVGWLVGNYRGYRTSILVAGSAYLLEAGVFHIQSWS